MHDRPTATELLADIGALLEGDVLDALDGGLKHQVRVASNLCRIIERELVLGPSHAEAETSALQDLLDVDDEDLGRLHATLAERIRDGGVDLEAAHAVLLAVTRDKVSVVKPGYDDFDFADEQVS